MWSLKTEGEQPGRVRAAAARRPSRVCTARPTGFGPARGQTLAGLALRDRTSWEYPDEVLECSLSRGPAEKRRRIFGAHAAHLRAQLLRCSLTHARRARCAARRFTRIWATWIPESLAEVLRTSLTHGACGPTSQNRRQGS